MFFSGQKKDSAGEAGTQVARVPEKDLDRPG